MFCIRKPDQIRSGYKWVQFYHWQLMPANLVLRVSTILVTNPSVERCAAPCCQSPQWDRKVRNGTGRYVKQSWWGQWLNRPQGDSKQLLIHLSTKQLGSQWLLKIMDYNVCHLYSVCYLLQRAKYNTEVLFNPKLKQHRDSLTNESQLSNL